MRNLRNERVRKVKEVLASSILRYGIYGKLDLKHDSEIIKSIKLTP
jgi:hypothetical protein